MVDDRVGLPRLWIIGYITGVSKSRHYGLIVMDERLPKRRNSLRHPGFDYTHPGCVFVTICTYYWQPLFGSVEDAQMRRSAVGDYAETLWYRLPERYPGIAIDTFVVMPDHLHAIIFLGAVPDIDSPQLSDVIKWYKVTFQTAYRMHVRDGTWSAYDRHLWQRGYHDRIIRNDRELAQIRQYIEDNPVRWGERRTAQ